jgi:hypothetical protein
MRDLELNGGYKLTSNGSEGTYVLKKKTKIRSGKMKGQVIWDTVGYYGSLSSSLRGYIDRAVAASNKHLPQAVGDAVHQVRTILTDIDKTLTVKL